MDDTQPDGSDRTALDLSKSSLTFLPREQVATYRSTCRALDLSGNLLHKDRKGSLSMLGLFERLLHLNLSGNQLAFLPVEICTLVSLETLELSNNLIKNLPDDITQLEALRRLSLAENPLHFSSFGPLATLPNLTALDLAQTDMAYAAFHGGLPERAEFLNMKSLNLSGNQLPELPGYLYSLLVVSSLVLSDNCLERLDSRLRDLNAVTSLDLSKNSLKSLPPLLLQLKGLRRLDCSFNKIRTVFAADDSDDTASTAAAASAPSAAAGAGRGRASSPSTPSVAVSCIDELVLRYNHITRFPLFEHCVNIGLLDISSNGLNQIPATVALLQSLHTLIASNNYIKSVSGEIARCPNLARIDLCGNRLTTLPMEIGRMDQLQDILLHENPLEPYLLPYLRSCAGLRLFLRERELLGCFPPRELPAVVAAPQQQHASSLVAAPPPPPPPPLARPRTPTTIVSSGSSSFGGLDAWQLPTWNERESSSNCLAPLMPDQLPRPRRLSLSVDIARPQTAAGGSGGNLSRTPSGRRQSLPAMSLQSSGVSQRAPSVQQTATIIEAFDNRDALLTSRGAEVSPPTTASGSSLASASLQHFSMSNEDRDDDGSGIGSNHSSSSSLPVVLPMLTSASSRRGVGLLPSLPSAKVSAH